MRSRASRADDEPDSYRERIAPLERGGKARHREQHLRPPVFVEVQAPRRCTSGYRAAQIDEVAVAVGAGADDGVREHDRVRLSPGDLFAERGAEARLIRRAGERGLAAEFLVRLHQSLRSRALAGLELDQFRVNEIDRADVETRRHSYATAARDEPLDEIEAHLPVIEAAVDVGARDVEKRRCAYSLGEADEHLHRKCGGRTRVTTKHCSVGIGPA